MKPRLTAQVTAPLRRKRTTTSRYAVPRRSAQALAADAAALPRRSAARTTLTDDDIPIPAVGRGRGGAAVAAPLCCGSAKAAAVGDLPNDDDMPIRALGRGHGGAAAAVGAGRKKSVAAVRDEKRPSLPVSRAER